jgi:2-dehydropantoate 2-reductase
MLFATALTNESIADALAMPQYRSVYIALAREVLAVAAARGITPEGFDGFSPSAYLPMAPLGAADESLDGLVAHNRTSAKTHSGIWRDLAVRKRPTEVDAQLGIVVTLGAEAGVATPVLARLITLIHDIERGARPQSLAALDALASAIPNSGSL